MLTEEQCDQVEEIVLKVESLAVALFYLTEDTVLDTQKKLDCVSVISDYMLQELKPITKMF